jgi:hypothetical protein
MSLTEVLRVPVGLRVLKVEYQKPMLAMPVSLLLLESGSGSGLSASEVIEQADDCGRFTAFEAADVEG